MKTYSVKQVAEMLNVNEETVRRWIRSGRLNAIQQARRSGSVITEEGLKSFLESTPRYARSTGAMLGVVGATLGFTALLGGIVTMLSTMSDELIVNHIVGNDTARTDELEANGQERIESIREIKEIIESKKSEIEQLQKEIETRQKKSEELAKKMLQAKENQEDD